jgi:predicted flap endonuclease-1-like 5' DNA nuclease
MHLYLSVIVFLRALAEGGEGEPSIPVYQLASLYWWGALLLISLVIFIAWLLISWQARYFDRQLALAGSHADHHPSVEPQTAPIRAPEVSVPPTFPAKSLTPDDLTLIEGIGPVISRLLQSKGIITFDALAQADPQDLDRILREANLRLANTRTWSEQARLAALGDFDGLRAFQSRLKGGREV